MINTKRRSKAPPSFGSYLQAEALGNTNHYTPRWLPNFLCIFERKLDRRYSNVRNIILVSLTSFLPYSSTIDPLVPLSVVPLRHVYNSWEDTPGYHLQSRKDVSCPRCWSLDSTVRSVLCPWLRFQESSNRHRVILRHSLILTDYKKCAKMYRYRPFIGKRRYWNSHISSRPFPGTHYLSCASTHRSHLLLPPPAFWHWRQRCG